MASKRRGVLAVLAGVAVVAIRGADEAATLLARGTDELLEAGTKGGDEAGSKADEVANAVSRAVRQERLESLLEDETAAETFALPPGYYGGYEINPDHRTRLSYEFTTIGAESIDVFLFDEQAFTAYTSEGTVAAGTHGVRDAWTTRQEVTLSPQSTYYLVFDNSAIGVANAREHVDVETQASLALV